MSKRNSGEYDRWIPLLNQTRLRDLLKGVPSRRLEGDSRTEFERDRDRTISSTPMRRLIGKTQVFPLDKNDHVRTRLVHSLEVSTVAEGLTAQVCRDVLSKRVPELSDKEMRDLSKVAETAALIHDFGNPPFGHAGELAIQSWFKSSSGDGENCIERLGGHKKQKAQDFLRFEGNAQTIRIVTNTHLLGDDHGLNLTSATTCAAFKYIGSSLSKSTLGHQYSKPGYFASEEHIVELIEKKTARSGKRHPVTYLIEAADDIVYSVVDLEDGVKKGLLRWETIETGLRDKSSFSKTVIEKAKTQLSGVDARSALWNEEMAQAFRVNAISLMVRSAVKVFDLRYKEIMSGSYTGELITDSDCEAKSFVEGCKSLLRKNVFTSPEVLKLEMRGKQVIHDLMQLFWCGIKESIENGPCTPKTYGGKAYLLLSSSYRDLFERRCRTKGEDPYYAGLQLLTDYVCNMTDAFACRLHSELFNG
jgi:dGTPase